MKDNENDFMLRYNFEAGEREFTKGRTTLIVLKHKSSFIQKDHIVTIATFLFMAALLIGASIMSVQFSEGDRTIQRVNNAAGIYGLSDAAPLSNEKGELLNLTAMHDDQEVQCKIPSESEMESKVALSCDNGIIINAK